MARNYQLGPKRLEVWKGEWRAKGEMAFAGTGTRPQGKLDAERNLQFTGILLSGHLPCADFYGLVKVNCFTRSHDSVTGRRSPEVSSIAFDAQPPDLPAVRLMDMGFAILCPLARHRRPHIRFLFIGSRLCSTLLSGPASRRVLFRPCASLTLHLHQTG